MPNCDPNLAGPKHVHNSPTHIAGRQVDSLRPGDRQMNILRNGELTLVLPQSVRPGDIVCDRMGRPLRTRGETRGLREQAA